MSLDLNELENKSSLIRDGSNVTIARCPACAEDGGDRKGEHLIVFESGRFGCAVFPGDKEHRQQIWRLAGQKNDQSSSASVQTYIPTIRMQGFNKKVATFTIKRATP